jgi:hypothetical protein
MTEGVSCSCSIINTTCGCQLNASRTGISCDYTGTLTLDCASQAGPVVHEIDCIAVNKVYDFCFEQDNGLTNCVAIEEVCTPLPAGSTASCTVTDVTCVAGTPVPTDVAGFSAVALVVTVTYDAILTRPNGTTCVITGNTFVFTKTVILCAPAGTTADCFAQVACGPCTILPPSAAFEFGQVCCGFGICLLVESQAPVKLLVPTYGFCTPAACQQGPFPPFTCPPTPLFPPQCS